MYSSKYNKKQGGWVGDCLCLLPSSFELMMADKGDQYGTLVTNQDVLVCSVTHYKSNAELEAKSACNLWLHQLWQEMKHTMFFSACLMQLQILIIFFALIHQIHKTYRLQCFTCFCKNLIRHYKTLGNYFEHSVNKKLPGRENHFSAF